MRRIALFYLFASAVLSLCSFYRPTDPPIVMPPAVHEERPTPMPYGVDHRYEEFVLRYCDETGVPVWMACRMFGQENMGDPMAGVWDRWAVSYMGAEGIAQLMPEQLDLFAKYCNDGRPIDPFDPETAIRVGIRHLSHLYKQWGSWKIALMCYNGGSGHLINPRRYGPWLQETHDYIWAILKERV